MDSHKVLDNKVLNQVKHYVEKIRNAGFRPQKVIVFGSAVKGTRHKYSDIDLCIVSDQFTDDNLFDDGVKLRILTDNKSADIEPHPMTSDDFNTKWYTLAHEIRTHGIEVEV